MTAWLLTVALCHVTGPDPCHMIFWHYAALADCERQKALALQQYAEASPHALCRQVENMHSLRGVDR